MSLAPGAWGKAQAVLGPSVAAPWAWEDVWGCGDEAAGAPGAALSLLASIWELCGEARPLSGVAARASAAAA